MGVLGEVSLPSSSTASSAGLTFSDLRHSWEDMSSLGRGCVIFSRATRRVKKRDHRARWRGRIQKVDATIATCTPEETGSRLVAAAGSSPNSPESRRASAYFLLSKLGAILLQRMPGCCMEDPQTEVHFYPPNKPRQRPRGQYT